MRMIHTPQIEEARTIEGLTKLKSDKLGTRSPLLICAFECFRGRGELGCATRKRVGWVKLN